jgi:hypothetical protein
MWRELELATEPNTTSLCPLPTLIGACTDQLGGRGDGSLEVLSLVVLGMIFLIVMMRFVRK